MELNINQFVKVKLTEIGLAELKRQDDEILIRHPHLKPFPSPKIDEDGYTRFQLWDLMKRLGHLCRLGFNVPFEPEIIVEPENKL